MQTQPSANAARSPWAMRERALLKSTWEATSASRPSDAATRAQGDLAIARAAPSSGSARPAKPLAAPASCAYSASSSVVERSQS